MKGAAGWGPQRPRWCPLQETQQAEALQSRELDGVVLGVTQLGLGSAGDEDLLKNTMWLGRPWASETTNALTSGAGTQSRA